ncbi:MAG: 23S rRNA (adenine(1618)-N(6))-methyltransferase RlmF [Ichthyobacteriaceae bacterium]|nr:23S rRNA (adenine(1618)-N(6))-methyltransferase RlmF [Ichthyobacteriaceae bacterium]
MQEKKRNHPKEKLELHARNKHKKRYNLKELGETVPELLPFVFENKYGDESIDFFNPEAVKTLNKALLKHYYGIDNWDLPEGYLTPPIPGRADYIHNIADLLTEDNYEEIPKGNKVKCVDIGVGANCVYPIIGNYEYGWSFLATDIDKVALQNAENISKTNNLLNMEFRLQSDSKNIFYGVFKKDELYDATICNPPFHASAEEAQMGTVRKLKSLSRNREDRNKIASKDNPILNFAGQNNELWCEGGEKGFVRKMILESKDYKDRCMWFTTQVSKESNLKSIYRALRKAGVEDIRTLSMGQGTKKSRIIAWTFLSGRRRELWAKKRWGK